MHFVWDGSVFTCDPPFLQDMYDNGVKLYMAKVFFKFAEDIHGISPLKAARELMREVKENMDTQSYELVNGRRSKAVWDKMIEGKKKLAT